MFIFAVIWLIFFNAIIHFKTIVDNNFYKVFGILVWVTFMLGLWGWTKDNFLVIIVLFVVSYINFCFAYRRLCKHYTIIFLLLSLFFIIWITVLFGKHYFDIGLASIPNSEYQRVNEIIDLTLWFPIKDFFLSVIFFKIAFIKYFELPEVAGIYSTHFLQTIVGLFIGGIIISIVFDVVKNAVIPKWASNNK